MVLNTEWAQVEVIDLVNDGSGLAFGIIGGKSTGVVVKTILPGGVADRDGRLQSGDHILQIGEVNLRGLGSEQVASVLRQCGVHVRMVVARPVDSTAAEIQTAAGRAPIVPTKLLGDPVELDKHLIENGFAGTCAPTPPMPYIPYIYGAPNPISDIVDVVRNPLPIGKIPLPKICPPPPPLTMPPAPRTSATPDLPPETETFTVELRKDDLGLGITVAGYVCEKEEISGIFVKSISKGSAADATNNIKVNDRIIEVNGTSVIGYTNHRAVEFLKITGPVVKIKFERYLRGPKFEQLQQAIKANELRPPSPPSPTVSSLPKIPLVTTSYLGIEPEGESRTSVDFDSTILFDCPADDEEHMEIVIDGLECKSVQFAVSSRESIREKWKNLTDETAQIVIAEMHKSENRGLGISLEGTVDVEGGKEVRPHHYIRNILPDGPVGLNGVLQSGDELLEVNGIQLLGLNHWDVVAILKRLPSFVCLVCARYPVPIRIIDTAQHPDAFQARKILAGSLQTLITLGDQPRLVKAKSESSIASSLGSDALTTSKSRSLELIAGLPMWSEEPTIVALNKGDHGLGFSILDYQDPLNPQETVIVIRSLVPGGVAQLDGRLIPGDRLLAVNDVNLDRATLDRAVQVLKGAPKGVVRIAVAKPLNGGDAVSHASQETSEDHTCLDDFQECIEEFQDDLMAVPIFIEDDRPFNGSPPLSQIDDDDDDDRDDSFALDKKRRQRTVGNGRISRADLLENNYLNVAVVKELTDNNADAGIGDSDIDISFRSTNDNCPERRNNVRLILKSQCESSDKDGYETCVEEPSLSVEESPSSAASLLRRLVNDDDNNATAGVADTDEVTPTNSRNDLDNANSSFFSNSAPCMDELLRAKSTRHIRLVTKLEPYQEGDHDNRGREDGGNEDEDDDDDDVDGDEFFLVQYPMEAVVGDRVSKSASEPTVSEARESQDSVSSKLTYKLREYYNDFANCLDAYRTVTAYEKIESEMSDSQIFGDILLPFRSRSAPNVMDRSFVTLTYDPGPDFVRRKSAFVAGYGNDDSEMRHYHHVIESEDNGGTTMPMDNGALHKHWGSVHVVKVYRDAQKGGLGLSIVGGKVDAEATEPFLGIFVKSVTPEGPAGRTGQFKTGDRLLEVSGVDLREATHERAVEAIRNAGNPVVFLVQSLIPWINSDGDAKHVVAEPSSPRELDQRPTIDFLGEETEAIGSSIDRGKTVDDENAVPVKTVVVDVAEPPAGGRGTAAKKSILIDESGSEDDEEDDHHTELEGRTVSAAGQQIDRASAANVKRTKEEIAADKETEDEFGYTSDKVKKKYGSLGSNIVMVQLERGASGLGLSLAGHRDRSCMAVFVCGMNPNGAAFKAGTIEIGDEILEVNGVVLHGRCHLNASAIIKSLSGPVFKVIILRRKTAIDDIAVKPITQFPISLAEEISEEHFSASYPNVRTLAIKKTSQSLGIMIIEGKHAEVGQGIFISDIQEGSAAEKAGLEIGEMILAVNKDSLVGSNYDTAANLLKRTEGLVTLVVSKPGKKDASRTLTPTPSAAQTNSDGKATLKTPTTPSRPATPVPEPAADPSTCSIVPGRETVIEISTNNEGLGICFIGGKDTPVNDAIILTEVYKNAAADKDGRLQAGDQILDVNGTSLRDCTNTAASQALRQTLPKMKITVFRPINIDYTPLEVDLVKKPGKGLGLSIIGRKSGKGVYIGDIIPGTSAELDGRIMRGDILISVNGQLVEDASSEEAGAILKTASGKVSLKLHRYKACTTNQQP